MRRPSSIVALIAWIVGCEAAGALAGWATRQSVTTWYPTLNKPFFTPPDALFAPVWIVLYALMGLAAYGIWSLDRSPTKRRVALGLFGLQLVFNVGWTLVFFGARAILSGLIVIVGLWLLIAATLYAFGRLRRWTAWLLVPYLLWVTYAVALNAAIAWLN
ncbi:TspO/MBR family protein [Salisaeta longa]|uniref:TspO/MBR family protein n=1 Tax=Salisaeta longa TaxID=503170 RepID=UPI0003B4D000|nr:TspO/MBR family protein [Salisaeta longa]